MRFSRWTPWSVVTLLALVMTACEPSSLPTEASAPSLNKTNNGKPGGDSTSPSTGSYQPILFVHGYNGSASTWKTMVNRFEGDGWPADKLHAWAYDYTLSNAKIAELIDLKVQEILAPLPAGTQVDIITHSMGALSSRYYAKHHLSKYKVEAPIDAWVSLGGPNHGTTTAITCASKHPSCAEMLPESLFLKDLNANDETPGVARYATWWSPCDEVIDPKESVILIAPDDSQLLNTKTGCVNHSRLHEDRTIYKQVRDWVHK